MCLSSTGLWQSASDTAQDLLARLAIVHMVHEARQVAFPHLSKSPSSFPHYQITMGIIGMETHLALGINLLNWSYCFLLQSRVETICFVRCFREMNIGNVVKNCWCKSPEINRMTSQSSHFKKTHVIWAGVSQLCCLHRGLDVHPQTLSRFAAQGDAKSVEALEVIYADEITHVAAGLRWFTYVCGEEDRVRQSHSWTGLIGRATQRSVRWADWCLVLPPPPPSQDCVPTFHKLVKMHFKGYLKPPFNTEGRTTAGMTEEVWSFISHPSGSGLFSILYPFLLAFLSACFLSQLFQTITQIS